MEFVSGVLAGALLGWFIDRLFGISPFGLIIFMLLGFASGLLNAVRSAKKAGLEAELRGNGPEDLADGNE
jgi:ATP synthase protein I